MWLVNSLKKEAWILSAVLMASVLAASAQTPLRVPLPGHVPTAVAGLTPVGNLAPDHPMRLSIHLPLRNRDALGELYGQIYDPSSTNYHHYLTPEEFDARFGPTEQDYEAVIAFVTAGGLTVTGRHSNRMLLEVSGMAADVERAFQVTFRTYKHPTEDRTFFAPDAEPSVTAGVPVAAIAGLNDFARPRPASFRHFPIKASGAKPLRIGSGQNGLLAGYDYRAAYAAGMPQTGAGQTIGVLEFDGYYPNDITSYESQTGVSNVPLQTILLDGFSGVPTTGVNSGNGEVALDIELAISMAPGLSQVVVFEADPVNGKPDDILLAMSTNTAIKQFSCSWSFTSMTAQDKSVMETYLLKLAMQGQSFFAASGDLGAIPGAITPPIDATNVTVVGGTSLAMAGPGKAWLSETVWNTQFTQGGETDQASGGGVSATYSIPPWQKGINMTTNKGSTSKRNVPDVAAAADNIFIVADNGQNENTGGTSCAAPLWAGLAALINQQAAALNLGSIGFINPALYHLGTNSGYSACFNDVVSGNNTNTSTTHYFAVPGYDLCTGLGTPNGGSLLVALLEPDGFQITPGRFPAANGPAGGPFTITNQTLSLTNTGVPAFSWSLGGVPSWLRVSTTGGTLTAGAGAAELTLSLNAAANRLPAGVFIANIWFTNNTSGLAQLRQFALEAGQELVLDGGFEASDFTYWTVSGNAAATASDFVDAAGGITTYSPYEGDYFAAFGEQGALAYISQPIPTKAGQSYLLSFWLENPMGLTGNQFQVQWNTNAVSSNILFNQTDMGAFSWSNMTFRVTASTNVTTLQFGLRNDQDFFALDDVSVQPIPYPSPLTPTLSAGLVTLTWPALSGLSYQVQFKTSPAVSGWSNIGPVITATTNTASYSSRGAPGPERFYRIALLP
jgi:hypothetical protein